MKTKWIVVGALMGVPILLIGSGAAPLIFGQIVYGCNLQQTLASGEIEHVKEHKITKKYFEKYKSTSTSTSNARSLEWGYGTVEYSSYFRDIGNGWLNANLKITIDLCGIPKEFSFQCINGAGESLVSLEENDEILEYLQNQNCIE